MQTKKKLSNWLTELANYNTSNIGQLPNIDLYMEQVTGYLDNELKIFMKDEEKIITSSMINNYVKANIVPSPNNKKYSKVQLSYLLEICSLKNILSLAEIDELINYDTYKIVFEDFKDTQDALIQSISGNVKKSLTCVKKESEESDLKKLAIKLSLQANIYKTISERIIYLLELQKSEEIQKLKKNVEKKPV